VGYSEKPDVVAGRVLEGHVAIISDGSPFVLTAPMLFIESFQTSEDYYVRTLYASMTRILRFLAFTITVFAPALFIALTTFHQELIPTTLLYTIADAREGTPFPAFFEALVLVFAFELLREAGVRLPRPIGQAISIVGALIMGDAAVTAGIVGAPMVIIIAVTAVSGFVVPRQNDAVTIIRLIAMVLASLLGGYGVAMVFLAMLLHLARLQSFGIPYFETVKPNRDMQDSYIRLPLWKMSKRPLHIARGDVTSREGVNPAGASRGGRK
jgi:spore germination protein KA